MEWYENYNIGVEEIDRQHRQLVAMVDRVQKSLQDQTTNQELGKALRFLVDYTREHFRSEEELMRRVGYPEYEAHKKIHAKLIQEVTDVLLGLKRGKQLNPLELIDFLVDWVIHHVVHDDKKIGNFIARRTEVWRPS